MSSRPTSAYVGGPMTGYPRLNFAAFDAVRDVLVAMNWIVHSPVDKDRESFPGIEATPGFEAGDAIKMREHLGPSYQLAHLLGWDLARIIEDDVLVLLPHWEYSEGANKERFVAEVLKKTILLAVPSEMETTKFGTAEITTLQSWSFRTDREIRVSHFIKPAAPPWDFAYFSREPVGISA